MQKLEMKVRRAVESDYEAVVELSEGVYDGLDYLPVVFHDWLAQQERVLFVAELEAKLTELSLFSLWMEEKPRLLAPGEFTQDTEAGD